MLDIKAIQVGPLQTNCYVLGCRETKSALIVDPGWSGKKIYELVQSDNLTISGILLTHAHFDHIGGVVELEKNSPVPIYIHRNEKEILAGAQEFAGAFGFRIETFPFPKEPVEEGQTIQIGNVPIEVIYTPGHSPGHVSYYALSENILFDGDVLFNDGIGRTDLPGGDYDQLVQSIQEKLFVLPDETIVYPGHGPATKIVNEKRWNRFIY